MSRTIEARREIGRCDLGYVFIHHFGGSPVDGKLTTERYEVRAGNHTIGSYNTAEEAEIVARTLCGDVPRAQPEASLGQVTVGAKGVTVRRR